MTLSRPQLVAQAEFFRQTLGGGRLQSVRVPDGDRVVLELRCPGRTWWVLLCVAPSLGRLHTIERKPKNPQTALTFQGLLRKELPAAFVGIEVVDGERIAILRFGAEDRRRSLVVELFGPGGNLVLLDEHEHVLGRARAARGPGSRALRGGRWEPPAAAPRPQPTPDASPTPTDLEIRERYTTLELTGAHARGLSQALGQARGERRRLVKLERRQRQDLERAGDPSVLRRHADLLRGSFHLLQRGQTSVRVVDWVAPGAPEVDVAVNPALAPAAQVEAAYGRVRRAERTREQAGIQLARTRQRLATLEAQVEEYRSGALVPPPPAPRAAPARSRDPTTRLPYRCWWTPEGIEIRVGRGAADNDALTFRHSKGNDVWMHVRGRPGAHVVIRTPGAAPSPPLLQIAAQLALVQSGLADGAREEVVWTRVKHVRKAKGMAPGKVLVGQEKVLYLETDRAAIAGLRRDG